MCITLFFIALITILFLIQNRRKNTEKIFGIYSQPGKWYYLKYVLFYSLLKIRKIMKKVNQHQVNIKAGNKTITTIEDLESPQTLSEHEKAFDAVFFHAVNKEGYYICGGIERRPNKAINGVFYLVIPGLGLLKHPSLPNTLMQSSDDFIHHGGGIKFICEKPMQQWRLTYNGLMNLEQDPSKSFKIDLDTIWTAENFPYFVIENDMSALALADAIARETWSKEFFQTLKDSHQTHYEQMGMLTGKICVDGKLHEVTFDAFRDHSFGHKRDWSLMHRYIFHMAYLENGTRICVGVISQPCTTSHLVVGYVAHKDGKIKAVDSCDLQLYQFAEFGNPPKEIAFTIIAKDEIYTVKAFSEYDSVHYKGSNNESKLIERFMKYDVNGSLLGRGISEWQWNVKTLNKRIFYS